MIKQNSDSYTLRAILVLTLLIIIAYSNTFRASWHFDDYPNIVHCDDIRVENIYPVTLYKQYRELQNGNHRQRPVTWLSFVLNWYWGQDNEVGYHAVNLLIHIISSVFVLLCCRHILSVYLNHKGDDQGLSLLSAFLAAALWALHPIQTQAVTYVVQRMASLSGMFYIVAFYFFLKAISKQNGGLNRYASYVVMGLFFFLALGAKPSAAMFPVAAGLFYHFFDTPRSQCFSLFARVVVWGGVFTAVGVAGWYFIGNNPLGFLQGYSVRPFSLNERLLTEGRVIVFYLMQLFLLKPLSFSLVHDISISTSLISPPSTLISIIFILLLVGVIWHVRKRAPLLSFSVVFFFINHFVESTVLPLELIYEHRNYIPSMFLFLPLSNGFVKYIYSHNKNNHSFLWQYLLHSIVILALMGLTIYRNQDWLNEKTFWTDAIIKAPGIARPYHNLARDYYERIGDYKTALELYQTALTKRDLRPDHKAFSYNNIASLYFRMAKYDAALEYTEKSLQLNPHYSLALYNKALVLTSLDDFIEAERITENLTKRYPINLDYKALYGLLLMKKGNYFDAEKQLKAVVDANPFHVTALMHLGVLQGTMGKYEKAERTLIKLIEYSPFDTKPKICLLDLYRRIDRTIMNRYMNFLLKDYKTKELVILIEKLKSDQLAPLLDYEGLKDILTL